ncbi:hypothetical protein JCM11641_002676 [Rhodosporidiobolus odoratus]
MVRFKHRYLLCHLIFPAALDTSSIGTCSSSCLTSSSTSTPRPPPQISESGLINLLRDSLSVNFGDVGAGEVGGTFSIKYLSPSTSTLIIRVSREHYRTLWAALTLLRKIGGQEVIARVVHISGTIRKTQHAAIAHDRSQILLAARRARLHNLKRPSETAISASAPTTAAVIAAEVIGSAEERKELEEQLKKSEEGILAMEA